MAGEILLSICIPTNNRSVFLEETIRSIVSQKEFTDNVELVISDNCSNDGTDKMVIPFLKEFPNIQYIKNEINIGAERNVFNVLGNGKGKYLKLLNDYAILNEGSLQKMLDVIKRYELGHNVILFTNNRFRLQNDIIECKDFDDFVRRVSFPMTWLLYFGIWKTEFDVLIKGKFEEYNFPHLDLMLRNLDMGYKPVIFNTPVLKNPHQKKHGGYNIFETFIQNYLTLLGNFVGPNRINENTYRNEKRKLLYNFVYPWYCLLKIEKDPEFSFSTENLNHYLRKYFNTSEILVFRGKLAFYRIMKTSSRIIKTVLFR